jgi:hypothetical protein
MLPRTPASKQGARYDISTHKGTISLPGRELSEKQGAEIQKMLEDLQGVKASTKQTCNAVAKLKFLIKKI